MTKNNVDKETLSVNEKYRKVMNLFSKAFYKEDNRAFNMKVFGVLLYFRQHDSLKLKTRNEVDDIKDYNVYQWDSETTNICLCCDRLLICDADNTNKQAFIKVLKNVIEMFWSKVDDADVLFSLVKALNRLDFCENELLALFDCAIKEYELVCHAGFNMVPDGIAEVFKMLLDEETSTIFDPFGGLMGLATVLKEKRFVAHELNNNVKELALIRLALAGVLDQTELYDGVELGCKPVEYDAIATIPPFGGRIKMSNDAFNGEEGYEEVALRRFDILTNEHGQLVTIVPLSFLSSELKQIKILRKKIIILNWLDTIIYLPSGIFSNTGIATAIIVLKRNRDGEMGVRYLDASNCVVKHGRDSVLDVDAVAQLYQETDVKITLREIVDQNYSWNLQWYLDQKNADFNDAYDIVEIGEVLTQVPLLNKYDEVEGYLVGVSDLSKDVFDYEKKPEDFPRVEELGLANKVTEPVILISMIREPRPTYCMASKSEPIFVKRDVVAYRITNETVDPGYLCMELEKRLKKATQGAVIPRFSRAQIAHTRIGFPSLNRERSKIEQKNLFEEVCLTVGLGKDMKERLELLLEKKKKEYIEEVRHRKHDMKTPMTQLRNTLTLLENMVPLVSGEPAEKLKLYLQRQKKSMNTLSEIVSHIADEDVFAAPEPIDLGEVLLSQQTKTDRYVVSYYPDKAVLEGSGIERPMVFMGKSDLLRLVQNIVENAVKRGFIGDYSEYALNIRLTIKEGLYVIDFSNNGEPLPDGLTKERYGMKGEKGVDSDGSGIGGYIVKSITEHYGGDYDVYSERIAGMWFTHVIVKLPIYYDNE